MSNIRHSFYREEEPADTLPASWKGVKDKGAPTVRNDVQNKPDGTIGWLGGDPRDNKHPATPMDEGVVEHGGGSAKVIPDNSGFENKEDRTYRFATRIVDRTRQHPELISEVQKVLRKVPPQLLVGVREVLLFPTERSSMYLSTPGHGGEHSKGVLYIPADKDWTGFLSWEEIILHEVGHSVHDFVLTGAQQTFLIQNVGWGQEWKEDFASAFGAHFMGDSSRAKGQHPYSWQVLRDLLGGTGKTAVRMSEIRQYTSNPVREKAKNYTPVLKRVDKKNLIWAFDVGKWQVKVKAKFPPRGTKFDKAELHLTCSCPFWRWQGPEHWGTVEDYQHGKPRGTASFPIIRDPGHEKAVCKHVYAVFDLIESYRYVKKAALNRLAHTVIHRYLGEKK